MKQLSFLLAMLLSYSAYSQLSDAENKALDDLIASQIEIEVDAIKATALKKVFDAAFFRLITTPHYENNGVFHETVLMKQNGKIVEVMEADSLVPFIRNDFKLNAQADAVRLKEALKLLLVSATGSEEEIIQKEDQWILVCEEWFGEKRGFVVGIDTNNNVKSIEYSDNLEI